MVVHDLDLISMAAFPPKADAPLIIDADAMLTFALALERLESIGGWHAKVL